MRDSWNWLSFTVGLVSALVIGGGIWGAVTVVGAQESSEQDRYAQCMADLGFTEDDPGDDLEALIAAAELCS